MRLTFTANGTSAILHRLSLANIAFDQRYPCTPGARQPVHVVYGGAQRFSAGTAAKLGAIARETMRQWMPDSAILATLTGMEAQIAEAVHPRVAAKLEREPVEDFRIDFEDGYGYHTDAEEDAHAVESANQLGQAMRAATLPPFNGIRIKAFSTASWQRAMRTLDLFLTALLDRTGEIPEGFVVTLPKITSPVQVATLHEFLMAIESQYRLPHGRIQVELMIETPQVIVNEHGVCALPALIEAAAGRCRGIHFGPYDYTSSIGIAGSQQSLHHASCDFARHVLQAAAAGTGIFLSDGPTKTIPMQPHAQPATPEQQEANRVAMHRAMRTHYDDVRRSLHHGFYQGWDLHPAQFPMRYAAVYAFFLEGLQGAAQRLRNFIETAAQATLLGTVFDDTASAQGLLNFFLQGWSCGALTESDVEASGLKVQQLRERSFGAIVEARSR